MRRKGGGKGKGKRKTVKSNVVVQFWGTIDRMCSMMCDYDVCSH